MAFVYGDRVKETSVTDGDITMVLDGAIVGFQSFGLGVGVGNECFYGILHVGDNTWEMGRGTVGALSLSRDIVFSSSNANNLVTFDSGDKIVYTTIPNVFYDGVLDSTKHSVVDHTVEPFFLLDGDAHKSVDHTAPPFSFLSELPHENIDHRLAPFNLLDSLAHENIDHTVGPFNLLDSDAHDLVDHKVGPLFLLDAGAHNALDHNLVTTGNNPFQVTPIEAAAGTVQALRSFSTEDVSLIAAIFGGGSGAPPFRLDTLVWNTETVSKTTPIFPFTPAYSLVISNFFHNGTAAKERAPTASIGFITGTNTGAKAIAWGDWFNVDEMVWTSGYDEDAVAGVFDHLFDRFNTNFSGATSAWELDVGVFNATGITIQPAGGTGTITGKMFLLTFGE